MVGPDGARHAAVDGEHPPEDAAGDRNVAIEGEDVPSDSLGQPTTAVHGSDDTALDAVQVRAEHLQSDRKPGSRTG